MKILREVRSVLNNKIVLQNILLCLAIIVLMYLIYRAYHSKRVLKEGNTDKCSVENKKKIFFKCSKRYMKKKRSNKKDERKLRKEWKKCIRKNIKRCEQKTTKKQQKNMLLYISSPNYKFNILDTNIFDSKKIEMESVKEDIDDDSFVPMAITKNGKLIATADFKTITFWSITDKNEVNLLKRINAHGFTITSLCFNNDGSRLASGSRDNTIKIFDVININDIKTETSKSIYSAVNSVDFNLEGTLLAVGSDVSVKILDMQKDTMTNIIGDNDGNQNKEDPNGVIVNKVTCVRFNKYSSHLAVGSNDGIIRIFKQNKNNEGKLDFIFSYTFKDFKDVVKINTIDFKTLYKKQGNKKIIKYLLLTGYKKTSNNDAATIRVIDENKNKNENNYLIKIPDINNDVLSVNFNKNKFRIDGTKFAVTTMDKIHIYDIKLDNSEKVQYNKIKSIDDSINNIIWKS